ncbi:ATP-dependent nuclease [Phytohabitans houttuyneae]|uniref:ATP-dependent nuclease n=1 Tax=Phytohabitans houttuyneae TaxID=1076126 RepID=UPI0015646FEB|nr:AAA family ATPase [Phytohabitans houttuyneae]
MRVIQAFRQIAPLAGGQNEPPTGQGLIDIIDKLQNPEAIEQPEAELKYFALNEFVSSVFDERGMRLEVPSSRRTINVRTRNNMVLPLENQGTGVHQVIIIAALATTYENTLVCIEEPEVNLHPILQRRLLKYLAENTSNQYVIATHSAQMLDHERANIFHLTLSSSGTQIAPATTPAEVANVCADLGYRPSDLLQANAIIWVEGPSDRTYLNHWVRQIDPGLEEGIHYSIMFYGGSLLKELSADDRIVEEFINLRRLNRNTAILIDSDRTYIGRPLNDTKKRVIREFEKSEENGLAWVTHGYTIENYVPPDILAAAIRAVHPRKGKAVPLPSSRWANPLSSVDSPNKSKIAKYVVDLWPDSMADAALKKQVNRVVQFIHRANVGLISEVH